MQKDEIHDFNVEQEVKVEGSECPDKLGTEMAVVHTSQVQQSHISSSSKIIIAQFTVC